MKKICSLLFLLTIFVGYSQQQATNWYFGDNAGINFDINTGAVTALTNGSLSTVEGCTTISDDTGNLVLYTDGTTVFDASHNVMQNGNGLLGDESSSQSAIVVPKPGDPNIYYIFTVGSNQNQTGLNYSIVDLTLNGGLGGITSKNNNLLLACSEKVSAVLKDCITGNIWVITLSNISGTSSNVMNSFHAFEVSNTGVSNTAVVSTFNVLSITDARGNLKFSPNGSMLACANSSSGLFVADFNDLTGVVSGLRNLQVLTANNDRPYGVEFSPNSALLYVTASNDYFNQANPSENNNPSNHSSALIQYDLNAPSITNSQITIDERQLYRGGLQLGPNGKIYRALSATYGQGIPSLGVINNPNAIGIACNYVHQAVSLGGQASRQGLPPFIQSFFSQQIDIIQNGVSSTELSLCTGDNYTLMADDIPGAVYYWYMDGTLLAESDFDLEVNQAGSYSVEVELNNGNCGAYDGIAVVSYYDIPVAGQPLDLALCDDDNDEINLFDFSSQSASILGAQDPLQYEVAFYGSLMDATLNQNEITGTYQNTSNPQTIYARVNNLGYERCHDQISFQIEVMDTPVVNTLNTFVACDNDTNAMDGFTTLDLSSFNAEVLGTQNPALYTVSYHSTEPEAIANTSPLTNNYINQIAFAESIYVRVENNTNTSCFTTEILNIEINPIPEAFDSDLYQCDEDGVVNGFTIFNLNEAHDALSGNTPDRSTQFYLTLSDAQNDMNVLNAGAYNNTSNPQTLHVRVQNDLTGCVNFSTLTLEVSTTQINDYIAAPICDVLGSEDGIDTFDLNSFSIDILSGLPPGLDISYYESYNDALLEQNILSTSYENTVPYSQTLYVRVENANACYGINEVLLTIHPLPELENDETILYCLNEYPSPVILEAGLINDALGNYTYSWSNGASGHSISVNEVGNYVVTVSHITTGCSKTRSIFIEPSNIASIDDIEIQDGSLVNNQITVIASGEGEYQYALVDLDGLSTPFQTSPVFPQIAPGFYSVLVRDIKNNCGLTEQMISVIGFPLYFTPNGDTVHDTWQVYGVSSAFQANTIIHIFDRYGKLITQVSSSSKGWDGTHNGMPLPANDYWFSVTLQDGRTYLDHFTLKR